MAPAEPAVVARAAARASCEKEEHEEQLEADD
jgi:hypothetical protein